MQAKLFALFLIAVGVAETAKCPSITTSTFDIKSVAGEWYLKQETPQSWIFPKKCTKSTYGQATTSGVSVTKEWRFKYFPFSLFSMSTTYEDTATDDEITEGKFTETKNGFLFHPETTYQVLDFSSTYMVLYSCHSHLIGKTVIINVLSNSTSDLSTDVTTSVETALSLVNLTSSSLKAHDQSCWT